MTVAILPNLTRVRAGEMTEKVCHYLRKLDIRCILNEQLKDELPSLSDFEFVPEDVLVHDCDFIICVGGDGSMIRDAKIAARAGKRVLGVNAGNLAYLCGINAEDIPLLKAVKTGEYTVQRRMLLEARLLRGNELLNSELVVNDVAFCRGSDIELTDIFVTADNKPIADYIGDGVIFATPTGSTAYSMSAGGPVAEPTLNAILLTPVCPHSLFFRPFIFSPETVFEVTKGNRLPHKRVYYSCDGGKAHILAKDCRLEIRRADKDVEFITIKNDNFIDVLNQKIINEGRMPR